MQHLQLIDKTGHIKKKEKFQSMKDLNKKYMLVSIYFNAGAGIPEED